MKQLPNICSMCIIAVAMAGCHSMPSISQSLSALDFRIDNAGYVVRAGETAQSVARRHRLTEAQLSQLNPGLNLRNLAPGTLVNIRQPIVAASRRVPAQNRVTAQRSSYFEERERALPKRALPIRQTEEYIPPNRIDAAVTTPTNRLQPQIVAGAAISDETLLGSFDDYSDGLPSMRVGTLSAEGFPVEEVVSNDYEIPENAVVAEQAPQINPADWRWPTNGRVARDFNPARPAGRAIDIVGVVGQDVYAVANGQVIFAGRDPSNVGKVVIIKHANDFLSVYSHTKDLYVATDDTVKAGDPIASLGPNPDQESMLRFELLQSGRPMDPMQILPPI